MTDYLIRTGKDGMVTDLMELGEDEPAECDGDCACCPIDCDKCDQLEAVTLEMIKSLNERLARVEKKIADLEARPMLEAEPLMPYRDTQWVSEPDWLPKIYFTCRT